MNEWNTAHPPEISYSSLKTQLKWPFPEALTYPSHLLLLPLLVTPKYAAYSSVTVHVILYFCEQLNSLPNSPWLLETFRRTRLRLVSLCTHRAWFRKRA